MALSSTSRGTGGNNTGATSITITPGSNLAVGSTGVLVIAVDNAGSSGSTPVCPSSVNDSVGNTWTRRQNPIYDPGAASAGVELAFYTSRLTTAFTTSNNVVLNFGTTVTAKAWALWEIVPASGKRADYVTGAAGTGSATGTPTVTTSSITNGQLVVGGGGAESASTWTGDADSSNGSWSSQQATGFGTGTSGMSVTTQTKVVNATATQTYNPTLTSADVILGWISLQEANISAAVDNPSETDTAQTVTRQKVKAVGQISETETAQSIAALKAKQVAVGQASITNTAQPVTSRKIKSANQSSETETAQPVRPARVKGVALVASTNSSTAVSSDKIRSLGSTSSTESAPAITVRKLKAVAQVSEGDSSSTIASRKVRVVGQISETDVSLTISRLRRYSTAQVSSSETALPLGSKRKIGTVTMSSVAESALVITVEQGGGGVAVGLSGETETAGAVTPAKRKGLGLALETGSAFAVVRVGGAIRVELHPAISIETAGLVFGRQPVARRNEGRGFLTAGLAPVT